MITRRQSGVVQARMLRYISNPPDTTRDQRRSITGEEAEQDPAELCHKLTKGCVSLDRAGAAAEWSGPGTALAILNSEMSTMAACSSPAHRSTVIHYVIGIMCRLWTAKRPLERTWLDLSAQLRRSHVAKFDVSAIGNTTVPHEGQLKLAMSLPESQVQPVAAYTYLLATTRNCRSCVPTIAPALSPMRPKPSSAPMFILIEGQQAARS